ncbi:MAG: transcriptional repressor [Planctomycetota bacterium]|nr:MAG: transcriptional repressor [Planctomycetota bacterium]
MSEIMSFFRSYFARNNLRLTRPRVLILEWITQRRDHFTAEDLVRWAILNRVGISRATIYRTLSLLTKYKLIARRDFSSTHSHYELIFNNKDHEHMICLECDRIYEFQNDEIERLLLREAQRRRFQSHFHNIKIYGLCHDCQNKREVDFSN